MVHPHDGELASTLRYLADQAFSAAPHVELVFVTNIQQGDLHDLGPDGILNTAQYYTRAEADQIIGSLQSLGVTVRTFFDEVSFLHWATDPGLKSSRATVVFTTAEGGSGSGRRALIPAACRLLGLPVLNSGPHACSIARHKFHANAVLQAAGVRVPETWMFDDRWRTGRRPPEGARVIVKPTFESMCIGVDDKSVRIVDNTFDRYVAQRNVEFGQAVLVQEFITGVEVGVPIVHLDRAHALPPMNFTRANGQHYGNMPKTFRDEVIEHDASHAIFDATASQERAIADAAILAFEALEMRGVGRIDLRVDADGRGWVFDTNESPPPVGGTAFSKSMEVLGFDLREMLAVWLGICLSDHGLLAQDSDQNESSHKGTSRP